MPSPSRANCAPAAAALIIGLALACGGGDRRVQVTYYYQNGSEALERLRPGLQGLETEFPQRVAVRLIDASAPDAKRDLTMLGYPSGGLVIRNHRGVMLFKQGGSDFDLEEVRSLLRQSAGAG
jgi:hypothetical protein